MLIGILACGHFPVADGFPERSYSDLYAGLLAGRGLTFRTWSVVDMEFPESVHDAEGWLITGSKYGAYDDEPFIAPLEAFIRKAYDEDVPLVGICFGHQIIAQALGGKVEKFAGGWSMGRKEYELDGERVALNAWHQDQVTEVPPEATVVGTGDFCRYAALAYKGRAFSIQPHPEFDDEAVKLLLDVRRAAVTPELAEGVQAGIGQPVSNASVADRIAAFFKESVHV